MNDRSSELVLQDRTKPGRLSTGSPWFTVAAAFSLVIGLPVRASADDVHLRNGSVFENVVAIEVPGFVRVKLGGGEIKFPVEQVASVEQKAVPREILAERKVALLADPEVNGSSFVDLANYAANHELESDARELALLAARLAPETPALPLLMARLGYVLEEGAWLSFEESQRRKGLVSYGNEWITREQRDRRETLRLERRRMELQQEALRASHRNAEQARANEVAAPETPSDNEVELARIELMNNVLGTVQNKQPLIVGRAFFPGFLAPRGVASAPEQQAEDAESSQGQAVRRTVIKRRGGRYDELIRRQPGSIMPIRRRP